MNFYFKSTMLNFFKQIIKLRRKKYISIVHWSDLHISIVHDYFLNVSTICEFGKMRSAKLLSDAIEKAGTSRILAKIAASFTQELQELFTVPRLNKFHESKNRIKKYQLAEAFISFLLQLLYHKTDSITGPCKNRIDIFEKELRFLLTILGDAPLMLCDEHEEFQNLLAEFEAVANEAGSVVLSILFSIDRAFCRMWRMNGRLGVVLNHIDSLKANVMKFLNHLSSISRATYITPMTSVVDSLLIVDSLVYDLEDLMNREDNQPIADVKDQIKILHEGLIFLRSSIKYVESPQPSEVGELKELLMRIGDMAREAEYLIISFLVGDAPLWYLINRLTDVNHKIELIGTKLQEFGELKVAKYFGAQLSLQAMRNSEVDDITVGFEDESTNILDQLVRGTERLQVISIFGMPGLGKTTLAKKLYSHPLVNYWFDKLSSCVISQAYEKQSILTNILIHLKSELEKDRILEMEEESLVEHIHKTLKGRRYLIVMDDVWDQNVWDDLRRCFPDDRNGSRILFTTRNKDVAPPNCIIYALPSLSNDQCWKLLKKKVFDNKSCPVELLGIGKKIAADCCGLPLTVVVIAGILSTMDKKKSVWEAVGGNLASHIFDSGDNSVMRILELSYKHLPEHLKPCFLYFGAFEKDREIPVGKLMRLWISEGFVRKEEEKSIENVAEEYLMELIDKSLVMVAKRRSDGGVKACAIHDLLHDLCLKRSKEENFLKFVKSNDYTIYEKGHRLQTLEDSINSSYCQHVRSFRGHGLTSSFYVRDMKLLRVLHFDYIYTPFIGIEFLVYLRYLVISYIPTSIGSLVNLEYLRVEAFETVYIPPAIPKMSKLRYLKVMFYDATYDEDCDSSKTNNLEFLSSVVIKRLKDEEMLRCSPYLRKLKCTCEELLKVLFLADSVEFNKFTEETKAYQQVDLRFLTQLESLSVKFDEFIEDKIIFPSNIKKLTLSGLRLPWEKMSIFGRLQNLEVLKLSIFDAEKRWDTRDGEFQNLKLLKLDKITNLTQWNVASREYFPNLHRLVLSDCYNLEEIPSEIGEIATVQLIEVKGECRKTLVESAKRIQKEQCEMGNEELRLIFS